MIYFYILIFIMLLVFSIYMSQTSWFAEKSSTAGLVAGFFGGKQNEKKIIWIRLWYVLGLALGWLFSSSVFVNNSVKVVANAFDFEKDQDEKENSVRRNYIIKKNIK